MRRLSIFAAILTFVTFVLNVLVAGKAIGEHNPTKALIYGAIALVMAMFCAVNVGLAIQQKARS